jgi:NAD(P)-dependent dehydrogenase (short-subunit alcohol dehydrogenase family)
MTTRFAGKTAVVVGAGGVVGRAIARRLATEGADIVAIDETTGAVDGTCGEVGGVGGNALGIVCDIADEPAMAAAAEECAAGRPAVHVLVNSHFAMTWASIAEADVGEWERTMRTNLLGPLVSTKAFLPLLRRAGSASVVHLGSVDGMFGNPRVPSYSATKGALIPLTHVMAHELAASGIRVNCVARAAVTDNHASGTTDGYVDRLLEATPLHRPASPDEVAAAFVFLASDDSSYITGSVLVVDGGRTGITAATG